MVRVFLILLNNCLIKKTLIVIIYKQQALNMSVFKGKCFFTDNLGIVVKKYLSFLYFII